MEFVQCRLPADVVQQAKQIVRGQPGLTMRGFVADSIKLGIAKRSVIKYVEPKNQMQDLIDRIDGISNSMHEIQTNARKTDAWVVLIAREMGVQL